MKLSFYGAAKEVTGSCYCVEANGKKILIDCGMKQGQDEKNGQKLPFPANEIDFVLLTHAHIDHSGRLPLLVKEGFRGKIYTVKPTRDLIEIMLKDSAKIQEMDAKWENKKAKREGRKFVSPLYSTSDVEGTLKLVVSCKYNETIKLYKGIKINFIDAGHILGSASVEIFLREGPVHKKIVFSGDIGNLDQPIIKDPQYIDEADYVVMEATYGDRNHETRQDHASSLAKLIDQTLSRKGNIIIPSFALGRTQELLYLLREIKEKKLVSNPDFPVYVDSPLGSEATRLYDDDLKIYGDSQTRQIVEEGSNPLSFDNLFFTDSVEASKAINKDSTPKVIISSSGMCEGGRIRHHLKHNLWRQESAILFVGFQAHGTLGREILEGAKKVMIYGEKIMIAATIHNFTGLSAHADKDGLLKWVNAFQKKPETVFVSHAEESVAETFVDQLKELGFLATAPDFQSVYDLRDSRLIDAGIAHEKEGLPVEDTDKVPSVYDGLVHAYQKLSEAVHKNKDSEDQDLKIFKDEMIRLTNKWR